MIVSPAGSRPREPSGAWGASGPARLAGPGALQAPLGARGLLHVILSEGYVQEQAETFSKNARLVGQAFYLFPQAPQHAIAGEVNCIQADAQLGGDRAGRGPVEHHAVERLPRRRLEVLLDRRQEPLGDVGVMLAVPLPAQVAVGVFEFVQALGQVAIAGGPRPRLTRAPEQAHAMDDDRAQPA